MGEEVVSDDEFHESFQDVTSSLSTVSAREGSDRDSRMHTGGVAPLTGIDRLPVWTPSAFQSKFSVWRDDPGTINERRERFFKRMGLKASRNDLADSLIVDVSRGFVSSEAGFQKPPKLCEETIAGTHAYGYVKPTCENCGSERKTVSTQGCAHLESLRPEKLGTDVEQALKSSFTVNGSKVDSENFLLEVTGSRALHEKNIPDTCCIVGGYGELDFKPSDFRFSISPGHKTCDCTNSVCSDGARNLHESCRNKTENISNQGSIHDKFDSDISYLVEGVRGLESGFQHQASSSQESLSQSFDTDTEYALGSLSVHNGIQNIMDERLKIRDLDSGKQFLMKKFNRDGSLNMLLEMDTGKSLTLAEFEKSLGLVSPVTQELKRRQLVLGSQVNIRISEPKTDVKAPSTAKRKGWLRKMKVAVKRKSKDGLVKGESARSVAAFDDSDDINASSVVGSISGDASLERNSSFSGLRSKEFTKYDSMSGLPIDDIDDSFVRSPQKVKVRLRQKSSRELSDLHLSQEILAHQGAIWTMKFSPDGCYLASAGQDRVIHVWEVIDHPLVTDSELWSGLDKVHVELGQREGTVEGDNNRSVKAGRDRSMGKVDKEGSTKSGTGMPRKQKSSNHSKGPVPNLFWLSEKPICSFKGHTEDILDLSWSRSQFLLSSSMDKTVRLWHISFDECLRVFPHNDYVTCAQFNPLDDRYFLSGSLDDKVRIWSIPDHHVADWSDLQEMVTAVCYTPDGKKAIVGSYKGTCRFYNAVGNKLQLQDQIDVREESKKARGKKITGLHCMPKDPNKVLVTSNDSRVRVYDGLDLVAKYKGLRNVKSQISSSFSPNGDFIISASEDSRVLVWSSANRDISNRSSLYRQDKQLSCEEFTSRHVSVAIAWPDSSVRSARDPPGRSEKFGSVQVASELGLSPPREEPVVVTTKGKEENSKCPSYCLGRSPLGIFGSGRKNSVAVADELTSTKQVGSGSIGKHGHQLDASLVDISAKVSVQSLSLEENPHLQRRSSLYPERGSTTWPEEKLDSLRMSTPDMMQSASLISNMNDLNREEVTPSRELVNVSAAWGLVIVTAGLGGEITTYQNYGFPVRP